MPNRSQKPARRGRPARRPQSGPAPEELHPVDVPPKVESFHEWPLAPEILAGLDEAGLVVPTPIQALAIQPVLEGRDVIAKAETGTGKTLAFGAPILSRIDPGRATVLALVLCPTRELAQQVAQVLSDLGQRRGLSVALVVGGDPMHPQVEALRAGAQIVVGTPGRVQDLYNQRFLGFPWTEYVVLDEADEMLEIGFLDDVRKILATTPEERQTLLFSATFPPELLRLAREHTRDPVEIATASGLATVSTIRQRWIDLDEVARPTALMRLIETSDEDDVLLVFCDRRRDVDQLMRSLERMPYGIKALHGGYDQEARFRVMSAFRTGEVKALVATDVASRGLDIEHVTHVVNYGPPRDVSDYTHRIGRTGRAGRSGMATTLVGPAERRAWRQLASAMNWEVEQAELPPRARSSRGRPADRRGDSPRPREREQASQEPSEGAPPASGGGRSESRDPQAPRAHRAPEGPRNGSGGGGTRRRSRSRRSSREPEGS